MVKKLLFPALLILATAASSGLQAQSLTNTAWKIFIGGELNDTLTLHLKQDSSFVTNGTGVVVVRSHWKMSGDTVVMEDYDGMYACLNMIGKYKISQSADMLQFALIEDACEGRAGSLSNAKWKKAEEK